MKYLLLIYQDETVWQKMPKPEAEKTYGEYFAFTESIKKSGHYLGGYYLIEARDHNDAIEVASRIPGARLGSIEVRPIMEVKGP